MQMRGISTAQDPLLASAKMPEHIQDFIRFEGYISPEKFLESIEDEATALIVGRSSSETLVEDVGEYIRSSDTTFSEVLTVSAATVETQLRHIFLENKFCPPDTVLVPLISDIALDVSRFSDTIASSNVELQALLQDRIELLNTEVTLEPQDFDSKELFDLVYDSGRVYHLDEVSVNQIKVYSDRPPPS